MALVSDPSSLGLAGAEARPDGLEGRGWHVPATLCGPGQMVLSSGTSLLPRRPGERQVVEGREKGVQGMVKEAP